MLYEQLYDYVVSNNLLSDRQFGSRQFHSVTSAFLDSTNEWFVNTDQPGQVDFSLLVRYGSSLGVTPHYYSLLGFTVP